MTQEKLFSPASVGAIPVANRIVMAPLTRNRATKEDDTPNDLHVRYYSQRATAGLIITEASQITPEGKGDAWTPGIYSAAQIAGWRRVTDAVHDRGGRIVMQLWHVGRVSHVDLQPNGQAPVAPSAIAAASKTFTGEGFVETSTPRALETSEIPRLIEDYRRAAANALEAGFDGVEIHAANGYLIDQFLHDGSNHRTDAYGGSVANRVRLLDEVTEAVVGIWGADRVGVRLSPFASFISDSDVVATFSEAVRTLNRFGLAYLHVIEGQTGGSRETPEGQDIQALRSLFDGTWIANNGYDRATAIRAVAEGDTDLVAFGRPFISNPDLVARLQQNAPLNKLDPDTLYGGGAKGYTDYPTLSESAAA